MIWPDPTHQPKTHPSTHQIIQPPMGEGVSTDFKSSNRIEISRLVQVLLNFEWFRESPLGVGGWVDGVGGWWKNASKQHAHACACMHVWHHREFPGIPPLGVPICMKLPCLPRMHVHVCVCMCTCVGAPLNHPPPPNTHPLHPQEPQEAENPKIQ